MKYLLPLLLSASTVLANSTEPTMTNIVQTTTGQEITWTTLTNHNYQIDISNDLLTEWTDTGVIEPGTGTNETYGFSSNADDLCFRVRETEDIYNGSLMTLPVNDQTNRLGESVGIAFDLNVFTNVFTNLPESISIYLREYDTGQPWEQYGCITNFMERDGIRFVRGSVVWIPDEAGVFEMRSVVTEGLNTICGVADRRVTIITNEPPTVAVNSAGVTYYGSYLECTTTVTDSRDSITHVDFFDEGIWVGRDSTSPFGDLIVNKSGDRPVLYDGAHSLTATAYDSLNAKGQTAAAFIFQTSGYSDYPRPKLSISNPINEAEVMRGEPITIIFLSRALQGPMNRSQ